MSSASPGLRVKRRPLLTDPAVLPQSIHPVLRRVYAARGLTDAAHLGFGLNRLHSHSSLLNVQDAANLLADAVIQAHSILVVGDFDTDGATSTALAVLALRSMGAAKVDYLVPNRFEYGYGLTPEIVAVALERKPDLIVTVDNGISSLEGVEAARAAGVAVLITDHHLAGPVLPAADVIVNPNLPGDGFPSKYLAGVGVVFYVLAALRGELRRRHWFEDGREEPRLADFLDLVALGTVADVVPLDYNNRVLVANGLGRIRSGSCRPGILALLGVAGRNSGRIVASDLGFAVAPRLNAAGRLDDMSLGIACLLEDDGNRARELASELDALNRERREIEQGMKEEAMSMVEAIGDQADDALPFGICLFDERWHQGVIGIVASRVRERFHRPAIVFAPEDEEQIRGSARSAPGVHIRDTLEAIASRYPGMLTRFGGHAMAAGLAIRRADLEAFSAAFDAEIRRQVDESDLEGMLLSDGTLEPGEVGLELAEILRDGGPWGQAFPEPLFDGVFNVIGHRVVGEHHLKMTVEHTPDGGFLDAIAFNQAASWGRALPDRVHLAYRLDVNEYRGARTAQLVVEQIGTV